MINRFIWSLLIMRCITMTVRNTNNFSERCFMEGNLLVSLERVIKMEKKKKNSFEYLLAKTYPSK